MTIDPNRLDFTHYKVIYHVTDNHTGKQRWIRIGTAFPNKRDNGIGIVLDSLPINFDGKLLLVPNDREFQED